MSWSVIVSPGGAALAKMMSSWLGVPADLMAILEAYCQLSGLACFKTLRNSTCNMMIRDVVWYQYRRKAGLGEVGGSKACQDLNWDPDQDPDQNPKRGGNLTSAVSALRYIKVTTGCSLRAIPSATLLYLCADLRYPATQFAEKAYRNGENGSLGTTPLHRYMERFDRSQKPPNFLSVSAVHEMRLGSSSAYYLAQSCEASENPRSSTFGPYEQDYRYHGRYESTHYPNR